MMFPDLKVTVKNVYGTETVYPACDAARLLCQLTGRKTFTHADIKTLGMLGYTFHVIQQPSATAKLLSGGGMLMANFTVGGGCRIVADKPERRVMDGRAHRFNYIRDDSAQIRYLITDSMAQYTFTAERYESHAQSICDSLNALHYCGILPALLGNPGANNV